MKILAAILAFVAGSTISATAWAFAFGGITAPAAILALVIGFAVACLAWYQTEPSPAPALKFWDYALLGVFVLVSYRAFCWLIFFRGDEVSVLSANNLGDISLHINFIRYLASGVPFWPESPILTGVPLTYPIGADLFNALGERLGVDTFRGLVAVGLAGALLTGYALWRWGGAFALAALLFNGGLAGFAIFSTWKVVDFQQALIWKNIFLSMVVTQRGLLFALPAGLLLLTLWRDTYFRGKPRFLPFWLEFLLYAGMPLFNIHAFLFLSVILAVIFVTRPGARRQTLTLVGASLIPASLLVCLVTGFFASKGNVRWEPDWLIEDKPYLSLMSDFGFTLPLILILCLWLIRQKDPEARCFVWSAAGIFLLCCVVVFAPWPWDNMKLMVWSWLVMAPYLWSNLLQRFESIPRAIVCIGLFFSGAISLAGGLDVGQSHGIASRAELAAWQNAVANIPPTERFAATPDFNHPLILLGRKVACGYDGHLWSHGLPYTEKYSLLKSAMAGQTPWKDAAPVLQTDWLALRVSDQIALGINPVPGQAGTLYDMRSLAKPNSDNPISQPPPPRAVGLFW